MIEIDLDGHLILARGQMKAVCQWLELHQIDPKRVPLDTTVLLDLDADEWVFTVHQVSSDGGIRYDKETQRIHTKRIRRRIVQPLDPAWYDPTFGVGEILL
jgi:hypothetical protein